MLNRRERIEARIAQRRTDSQNPREGGAVTEELNI
jgi:hypothetical protein